jgi:hypothetical protein
MHLVLTLSIAVGQKDNTLSCSLSGTTLVVNLSEKRDVNGKRRQGALKPLRRTLLRIMEPIKLAQAGTDMGEAGEFRLVGEVDSGEDSSNRRHS